jgi:plasmid stability protein
MATITIRDLDEGLKAKLRVRAAEHGMSMEAEVRAILARALDTHGDSMGLARSIHSRFAEIGGVELAVPQRTGRSRAAKMQ